MRVTDLEKFALEQIWRPYQNMAGFDERRLEALPMSLEETATKLLEPSAWRDCVMFRLRRIGVSFPAYIHHPLADIIRLEARDGTE